ncbi:hypothetical protein FALCPG4_012631 [Fusarium falciforme]
MVAVRPLLVLSMVAGIAVAGKCRPSSSISASTETSLTSLATETTVTASTTETTTDTATETSTTETTTSLTESTAETSTTETTIGSTTDTTLTTFMTSLSSTETTTEAATTTSEAAVVVTCPSTTEQCLHTMKIQCDYILAGISYDSESDLDTCAHKCDNDPSCALFVFDQTSNNCYLASSTDAIRGEGTVPGWVSGIKGRCGQ